MGFELSYLSYTRRMFDFYDFITRLRFFLRSFFPFSHTKWNRFSCFTHISFATKTCDSVLFKQDNNFVIIWLDGNKCWQARSNRDRRMKDNEGKKINSAWFRRLDYNTNWNNPIYVHFISVWNGLCNLSVCPGIYAHFRRSLSFISCWLVVFACPIEYDRVIAKGQHVGGVSIVGI